MTQAAQLAQYGASSVGLALKNRIINGGMVFDQRNAGASTTPSGASAGTYTLDRWCYQAAQTGKFTVQQNAGSVTPPVGFTNYLGLTSTSAYSVLTGDYFNIYQAIEGFNVADLAWGTANAKTVTLSFWVRSSLTGTFGGVLKNGTPNRSYPFTYTISAANTWEQKSVVIPGDTTGTWLTNNGVGIYVMFGLGVGSTFSGTAGAWAGSNFVSATGATSVVGTNGATFYITGVQLEVGSTATSFDYRPYGTEFALCQRYYQKSGLASTGVWTPGSATNAGGDSRIMPRMATTTDRAVVSIPFPVLFRSNPTLTLYPGRADATNTANRVTVYNDPTLCTFTSGLVGSPAAITGTLQALSTNSDAYSFQFTADAEL